MRDVVVVVAYFVFNYKLNWKVKWPLVIFILVSLLCVYVVQRLEETFAQQLDEMETLYGGSLIVSMPADTLQRDHFTGSTRSSLSSYSEGWRLFEPALPHSLYYSTHLLKRSA